MLFKFEFYSEGKLPFARLLGRKARKHSTRKSIKIVHSHMNVGKKAVIEASMRDA